MRVTLKAACSSDGAATTTFPPLFSLPSSLSSFLSALRANPTEKYKTITVARVAMKIIASCELRCSSRLSRREKHSHGIYFRKYFYFSPPFSTHVTTWKTTTTVYTCIVIKTESSTCLSMSSFHFQNERKPFCRLYRRHREANKIPSKMARK